ncbi:pentapeptide repeat-containing protein [Actinomadura sp. SCN-SB]|uniref:pentapeptide repeat-containing protein n=1 Tax=Actinomadura sp. SCN-SB TaxID=3373092 RepID=UPI00375156BC
MHEELFRYRTDLPKVGVPLRRRIDWRGPAALTVATLLTSAVLVLLGLAVFALPNRLVPPPDPTILGAASPEVQVRNVTDLAQARNAVRGTLVQAIGGAAVLITAFVAWRQVQTLRRGQQIERFTRSIDQLGDDRIEVRLGAVHALGQLARDRRHARMVAEVLSAFVRMETHAERSRRKKRPPDRRAPRTLRADLQACLRVLAVDRCWVGTGLERLDLTGAILRHADLHGADLSHMILHGADLTGADLREARLDECDLRRADFSHADLTGASITSALLGDATLRDAWLHKAVLDGADADGADFTEADLSDASLDRLRLMHADLRLAHLDNASHTTLVLANANLDGAVLTGLRGPANQIDIAGATITPATQLDPSLEGESHIRLKGGRDLF